MPNNRAIYWGIVLLVVTVLLWIGAELTRRIAPWFPYMGAAGVALIVGGFVQEVWRARARARA